MKILFFIACLISLAISADTLMDALLQGTFDRKVQLEPTDGEDTKAELNKQKIIFHYLSAPIRGVQVEVKNDGLDAYVKALYSDNIDDINYTFSANSYTSNATSYTMDLLYNLRRDFAIGSRYTVKNANSNFSSYSEIYTSLNLNEFSQGLNVGLSYDKVSTGKDGDKVSLTIKSPF